jgi:hypothetical protein
MKKIIAALIVIITFSFATTLTIAQPVTTNPNLSNLTGVDLRQFATLSCNPASPSSTNVAAAVYKANQAGFTHFFMPAGCFLYLGDAAWTAHFTVNVIPTGFYFQGENWATSGISVCSTYTGCTPGSGTLITGIGPIEIKNMFTMDGACYNVDSGAFGNPVYCPISELFTNAGSFDQDVTYPGQAIQLNIGAYTNGTWNGTDQPGLAINQETQGDVFFINDVSTNTSAHLLNFFNRYGTVATLNVDGKFSIGTSSTVHSGNGMIQIADAYGTCNIYANTSGAPGFACSSDERLKKDIHKAKSELPYLMSFPIRDYVWKKNGIAGTSTIAQQMLKVHPEMVRKDDSGYYEVAVPEIWKLTKAMQEMQTEIVELKQRK